jgi:branched-chain amino acid transport system permease protein
LLLAILATIATMALIGIIFQRVAYWPLRNSDAINVIISTIGVGVFLNNGVYVPWGKAPLMFPDLVQGAPLNFFGAIVPLQNVTIIVVTILLLVLQSIFFNRTWVGKQMQAVAQNQNTAALMGIRVPLMIALTFAYSTGLGSVAGVFMAPLFFVSPNIASVLSKAFAATVVGGFGSIPGAIVGGLFVGLVETFGAFYLSSAYKDAWAFALLIAFLLLRPQGIFGEKVAEKV